MATPDKITALCGTSYYEDASLSYTGIDRHEGEARGGWDTSISDADYNKMFALQQASMEAPTPALSDLPTNADLSSGVLYRQS